MLVHVMDREDDDDNILCEPEIECNKQHVVQSAQLTEA
jgi:hypothetical protein